MASTYTTNLGLNLPARGDYLNTWDTPLNGNLQIIDSRLGATLVVDVSKGSVALTAAQVQQTAGINAVGAIGSDVTLTMPNGIGGIFAIYNGTTGSGRVFVVLGPTQVLLVQGARTIVYSDGTYVGLGDGGNQSPAGTVMPYAGASTPAGYLLCFGEAVSRVTYASLFAAIGTTWGTGDGSSTFNLPDLRGRVLAGADNMGGTAAGNLNQLGGLGSVGGTQGFALAVANLPSHNHTLTDPGHNHTLTDPQHQHSTQFSNINDTSAGSGGPANAGGYTGMTAAAATGITLSSAKIGIAATDNTGSGNAFSLVQPTAVINWIIKY